MSVRREAGERGANRGVCRQRGDLRSGFFEAAQWEILLGPYPTDPQMDSVAGMVIARLAGLAAVFLQVPALGLAVSATVALLSAGLILHETRRIVTGGETNGVLDTVGL